MGTESRSFGLLHRSVQRWVYDQGWTELRDAQEEAIAPILEGARDVIIAAATAGGKTEAAFLPICSRLLGDDCRGATVLYVSPLKALINDQNDRMERLCKSLAISVHPWHGDIAQSRKRNFLKRPEGILLITPESLESVFVNHGTEVGALFERLRYVVVDELHNFIGTERGKQLQSLLNRLEYSIKRRVPRIALSATLGDMHLAAEYLRPRESAKAELIVSSASGQALQLLVRGYRIAAPPDDPGSDAELQEFDDGSERAVADDLFGVLRGTKNLVFANRRADVERYSDLLARISERERMPNEFRAHHGSLAKDIREEVEAALKDKTRPCTAICTSTLELGIDIGSVNSIAQLGAPNSVASLRQRLGRSGRRGDPAILRVYVREPEIHAGSPLEDRLHFELVETIAMVDLLLERWCEPPRNESLHLSTLVHQILSVIAQYGGVTVKRAWSVLSGTFEISQSVFLDVLRSLGGRGIIRQERDGTLLLDQAGERIVNHYSFYAVFSTPDEYRIVCGTKTLGTLPISRPLEKESMIIFAGRRWRVVTVDEQRKLIEVRPASGGRPPSFGGERGDVHDRVRQRMQSIYAEDTVPAFLESTARRLLGEARLCYTEQDLSSCNILADGRETVLFTWMGDQVNDTIKLLLAHAGLDAYAHGPCIRVSAPDATVRAVLARASADPLADPVQIAAGIRNKWAEKYDFLLGEGLLNMEFASRKLNLPAARATIQGLIQVAGTGV